MCARGSKRSPADRQRSAERTAGSPRPAVAWPSMRSGPRAMGRPSEANARRGNRSRAVGHHGGRVPRRRRQDDDVSRRNWLLAGTREPGAPSSRCMSIGWRWPSCGGGERLWRRRGTPDVVIHAGDRALTISAHSYCYGDVCADGDGTMPRPDAGASPELFVEFPIASWSFTARIVEADTEHGQGQTVPLEPQPDGRWRLGPAGVAGSYDIWLSGRGEGDDAGYVFRWTSTDDG